MSTCEKCWNAAFTQSRMLGGTQVEHYHRLLEAIKHESNETEGES